MKTAAQITAVLEEDVPPLLDLLGVGDDYHAGRLLCSVCQTPLLTNGLGAVRRAEDEGFLFACARLDCLEAFHAA
jgi:hypothetical protein